MEVCTADSAGLEEILINKDEVCLSRQPTFLIVSEKQRNFDETFTFCKRLGEMAAGTDMISAQEMMVAMTIIRHDKCGTKMYTGYTDREQEGLYLNIETEKDNNHHCEDGSDELDCSMVQLTRSKYSKERPPTLKNIKKSKVVFSKTIIEASFTIIQIMEVRYGNTIL